MNDDFQRFIRDTEGELSAARETHNVYRKERADFQRKFASEYPRYKLVLDKCDQWQGEINHLQKQLDRAKAIATPPGPYNKAPEPEPVIDNDPSPPPRRPFPTMAMKAEAPKIAQKEVTAQPQAPFPSVAVNAGFDRAYARHKIRGWRASYPLATSYKPPSKLETQALIAEITEHEDYRRDWLDKGNPSLTGGQVHLSPDLLNRAAEVLGLNAYAIRKEARLVHNYITCYGERLVDFQW